MQVSFSSSIFFLPHVFYLFPLIQKQIYIQDIHNHFVFLKCHVGETRTEKFKPYPKNNKKKKSSALLTAGAKAWKWEAVAAPEEIPNIQHAPSQWVLPTQTPSTVGNICLQTQRFATAAMSSQALRGSSWADTASTGKCKICLGTARKAVVELSSGGVWEKHYGQKIGDAFVREDTV